MLNSVTRPDLIPLRTPNLFRGVTDWYQGAQRFSHVDSDESGDPYVEAALQAPPSPDYVPGPEEPEQGTTFRDYVPGQCIQMSRFRPEADPEEDDNKDLEEDPVDYSADGGVNGEDEDEPSEEDEDDDVDMEADGDEEEDEHLAPADSLVDFFSRSSSSPVWSDAEVARLLAISTHPHHTSPHGLHHLPRYISSTTLHNPHLCFTAPLSSQPISFIVAYQLAMIRMRAKAASTSHSLPLPPPFILSPTRPDAPSLGIPSPLPISVPYFQSTTLILPLLVVERTTRGYPTTSEGVRLYLLVLDTMGRSGAHLLLLLGPDWEVLEQGYGFVATMDREIRHDPEREIGYGITDSWDEIVETLQGAPVSTDMELGRHMTTFETRVRQDTDEIYTRLDDKQSQRQLLAGRLNMLFRDRRAHAYTRHQMETKAPMNLPTFLLTF
ncbi:hypothetical protein Tco_0892669 [Tanacetum coccineum]|uniref:Uncharacterized protein n=1 Tax=Tanacetum coccineum TaxID=301880 RepID=A0ABQ5C8B0_9ASTR